MAIWETPAGALAINLIASVMWDGGKTFARRAKSSASDARLLRSIETEIARRTGVALPDKCLSSWLNDAALWDLVAEASRDNSAQRSAADRMNALYLPDHTEEEAAAVLSVLLIEISRHDGELKVRLREAKLDNKLDVLEVSLGYVFEELLTTTIGIGSNLNGRFDELGLQLGEVLERLPEPLCDGDLERSLRRVAQLVEQGILMREAGIQLQVVLYTEGSR